MRKNKTPLLPRDREKIKFSSTRKKKKGGFKLVSRLAKRSQVFENDFENWMKLWSKCDLSTLNDEKKYEKPKMCLDFLKHEVQKSENKVTSKI